MRGRYLATFFVPIREVVTVLQLEPGNSRKPFIGELQRPRASRRCRRLNPSPNEKYGIDCWAAKLMQVLRPGAPEHNHSLNLRLINQALPRESLNYR